MRSHLRFRIVFGLYIQLVLSEIKYTHNEQITIQRPYNRRVGWSIFCCININILYWLVRSEDAYKKGIIIYYYNKIADSPPHFYRRRIVSRVVSVRPFILGFFHVYRKKISISIWIAYINIYIYLASANIIISVLILLYI